MYSTCVILRSSENPQARRSCSTNCFLRQTRLVEHIKTSLTDSVAVRSVMFVFRTKFRTLVQNSTKRDDRRWRGARQLRCEVFAHECADRAGFTSSLDASGEWSVRLFVEQRDKPKSEEILHLLEICLRESSFKFRGQFYEMTNGLAMGCPVSPIVANIFYVPIGGEGNQCHVIEAFALATFCGRRSRHCETSGIASHVGNIERAARRHHVHNGSGRERTAAIFGRQNRAERQPAGHLRLPEANGHR